MPETTSPVEEHLLAVAHCPVVRASLDGASTRRSPIIGFQTEHSPDRFQVPTPWVGRLDKAPILIVVREAEYWLHR